MKFFTFFLLSFISISSPSQAGLRSSFDSFQSGEMSTRESMTGRKSGWGLLNEKPSEIDLSEWGGKPPSCDIAPDCPVCIK
tara:strand:+ start:517 stop:759 length:243 start_codon:yes stop_codon:yes gene_type:complete